MFSGSSFSLSVPMGEEKEPLPLMGSANCARRQHEPFRIPPVCGQLSEYPSGWGCSSTSGNNESEDVLQKEPLWLHFAKDAPGIGPQVAGVGVEESLAGEGVALARDTGNDAIHAATPCPAVEGSEIRPHRRRIQAVFFHALRQERGGECFPLNVSDDASRWHSDSDGESEAVDAGAKGQDVPGT